MEIFNEDSNNQQNDSYINYLGEIINSSIGEITDSNFSFSEFSTNKGITSYICQECGNYPIISFFCEEEIGIKCCCGYKKIPTKEYVESLKYLEKQIKCKCREGGRLVCYCFDCNKDICNECKNNDHNNHNIKEYEAIIKEDNIEELEMDIILEMKNEISEIYFKKNSNGIIFQNSKIEENMIFDDLDFYKNCDEKLEFPPFINLISIIFGFIRNCGYNYSNILNIKNIHIFLEIRKKNRLIIEYKFPGKREINIFGKHFVENNKDKCEIVFNNKKEELKDKLSLNQKEDSLTLILIGNSIVTDMSELFNDCADLVEISDKSIWDTSNVKYMNKMFNDCLNLKKFPEIKGWTTMNVLSLEEMFNNCWSLEEIEGLSKWKINNVVSISGLFSGCSKLKSLPDLSSWGTNKVTKIKYLFNKCELLNEIKGIQNWNISNIDDISGLFCECKNLKSLPDLSNWKIDKVTNMESLFKKCELLEEIKGIQNWDISNVKDISNLFCKCHILKYLPDLSLWKKKTNNIEKMEKMFKDCNELKRLPDISVWDVSKVNDFSKMFLNCIKLESLPDLSKWSPRKDAKKSKMFINCESIRCLPNISKWFIKKDNLIDGCLSLQNKPRYNNGRYIFKDNI